MVVSVVVSVVAVAVVVVAVAVVSPNVEVTAPVVFPRPAYNWFPGIQSHALLVEETGETMAGPEQEAAVQPNMMQLKATMHLAAASLSAASSPHSDSI